MDVTVAPPSEGYLGGLVDDSVAFGNYMHVHGDCDGDSVAGFD